MFDPRIGRWTTEDPVDLAGGDANLYRYVGNNATNATDPTGLWTWRIDPTGKLLAIAEANDTLNDLVLSGYDKTRITKLGVDAGLKRIDQVVKQGTAIDLTSFLPKLAQEAIRTQQTTDYEKLRARIEIHSPGLPKVPKGRTIGTSGIDLAQANKDLEFPRRAISVINDNVLGIGNCHGFTGLMLGSVKVGQGVLPQHVSLGEKPGAVSDDLQLFDEKKFGFRYSWYFPRVGVVRFLTSGMARTQRPSFGSVAIYHTSGGDLAHSAFVLGRSRNGDVCFLHKLNEAQGIVVTTSDHARLRSYDRPVYYRR